MNTQFDLNEALEQIKAGAKIDGKDGLLSPLIKQLIEAVLEAELESHLSTEIRNRKNSKSSKTMKSSVGEFNLDVPRDRNFSLKEGSIKLLSYDRMIPYQIPEPDLFGSGEMSALYPMNNSHLIQMNSNSLYSLLAHKKVSQKIYQTMEHNIHLEYFLHLYQILLYHPWSDNFPKLNP